MPYHSIPYHIPAAENQTKPNHKIPKTKYFDRQQLIRRLENISGFVHGIEDATQDRVAIFNDHVSRILGVLRHLPSHGYAEVRALQGRYIILLTSCDSHLMPQLLVGLNDHHFLVRRSASEDDIRILLQDLSQSVLGQFLEVTSKHYSCPGILLCVFAIFQYFGV